MMYLAVSTMTAWFEMRQWAEVPAIIIEAELETHEDSDGGTTYRTTARYRYTFEGREYEGGRVALGRSGDNLGSFQQDAYRELKEYAGTDAPFRCFVNPARPSDAVLYRQLRPEMLVLYAGPGLAFGGVGAGIIAFAVYGHKVSRTKRSLRALYPEQPWRWKEAWAEGTVRSSNKASAYAAAAFAILWNVIAIPIAAMIIPQALREGERAALLILVFPAVGVGLAAWAFVAILRWRKYGESIFQMTSVPGVIGGQLAGVVYTQVNLRPEDGFRVTLNCIRRYTTGSGKNRSTREDVVWQETRMLQRELLEHDITRSAIPVLFTIPYDAQETCDDNPSDCVLWRLEAEAAVPGVDYKAQFEVPVYKTADSRDNFVADETPLAAYQAPVDIDAGLRAARIYRTPLPSGGCRYAFGRTRQMTAAVFMTLFFLVWGGAIVFMAVAGAPIFLVLLFLIVEIVLGWFILDLLKSQRVEASFQVLNLHSALFGFSRTRTLHFADIACFEVRRGMQMGSKLFHNVVAMTNDGSTHMVAKHIPDRKLAETIVADIERALSGA